MDMSARLVKLIEEAVGSPGSTPRVAESPLGFSVVTFDVDLVEFNKPAPSPVPSDPYSFEPARDWWRQQTQIDFAFSSPRSHAIISPCDPYTMDFDAGYVPPFEFPAFAEGTEPWT